MNGVDNFVREAMHIQEEEKASGKPAAKVRPTLKPSSISDVNSVPIGQRKWIDIETQESNVPYCFQASKFITRLLRHSQEVHREADGAVHYDQVIDECKRMQSDNTEYWSDEMKKDFVNAPYWSIEKWVSVLAKGGGQKKRFQYCLNPNYPHQFLYFRTIQGHSGSTINPALQDNVLLPEGFTECIFYVGNGKRIEVNWEPWFDSKRSQSQNGQTSCILHYYESGGQSRWLWGHPMRLITSKNRAIQKYLETLSEYSILVQFEARSTKRTAILSNKIKRSYSPQHTLLAEYIEKAICMKTKDQLYQRESVILRPRVVLEAYSQCGSQDRPEQEARSSWESQQDAESCGETRSNTADYRILGISILTVKLQDARRQNNVTKLSEMFEKQA